MSPLELPLKIIVKDENIQVAVTQVMDFVGAGVTASAGTGKAIITIGGGGVLSGTVTAATTFAIAASAGASTEYARNDHTHGTPGGNMQLAENEGFLLDAVLSATGKYCGIMEAGVADTVLAFGDCCYLKAGSTRWAPALANTATTSINKLGICILAATAVADTTTILLYGKVSSTILPSLTVGAPVYISAGTAGRLVTAVSSTATGAISRIVGYGNATAELQFDPDKSWIEYV